MTDKYRELIAGMLGEIKSERLLESIYIFVKRIWDKHRTGDAKV